MPRLNSAFRYLVGMIAIGWLPVSGHSQPITRIQPGIGISLGWTLSGGLRMGIDMQVNVNRTEVENFSRAHVFGYTLNRHRLNYYRKTTTNRGSVFYYGRQAGLVQWRAGLGSLSHSWGYGGVNRCRVPAFYTAVQYQIPAIPALQAGSDLLLYPRSNYRYFDKPVWSAYAAGSYRLRVIER